MLRRTGAWLKYNMKEDIKTKKKVSFLNFIFSGLLFNQPVHVGFVKQDKNDSIKTRLYNLFTVLIYCLFVLFTVLYFFYYPSN